MTRLILTGVAWWLLAGLAVAALWAATVGRIRRPHRGRRDRMGPYEAFDWMPHDGMTEPWPPRDAA